MSGTKQKILNFFGKGKDDDEKEKDERERRDEKRSERRVRLQDSRDRLDFETDNLLSRKEIEQTETENADAATTIEIETENNDVHRPQIPIQPPTVVASPENADQHLLHAKHSPSPAALQAHDIFRPRLLVLLRRS